jgi:hypothetical protein
MPPSAQWTRFLPRGVSVATGPRSSRRLISSRTVQEPHGSARKRSRLPPLSVALGAGAATLALTSSAEDARQLRDTAHMGVMVLHENETAASFEDVAALVTQWSEILRRGGLEAAQDELVERLLHRILRLQADDQSQEALHFLVEQGALPLLVQYMARNKPAEPKTLQRALSPATLTLLTGC